MRLALTLASVLLVATGCSDDGTGSASDDPTGDGRPTPGAMPTTVPEAPGPVTTRGTATVMDTGTPELCVGPVAESYPPQCGGPAINGWDWDEQKLFEKRGGVRWGAYALTGTWDGESFTVEKATPAAHYDPGKQPELRTPPPLRQYSEAELQAIAAEAAELPGVQSISPQGTQIFVDVTYDDGTLQSWADLKWGSNTVVVVPALVDVS